MRPEGSFLKQQEGLSIQLKESLFRYHSNFNTSASTKDTDAKYEKNSRNSDKFEGASRRRLMFFERSMDISLHEPTFSYRLGGLDRGAWDALHDTHRHSHPQPLRPHTPPLA